MRVMLQASGEASSRESMKAVGMRMRMSESMSMSMRE